MIDINIALSHLQLRDFSIDRLVFMPFVEEGVDELKLDMAMKVGASEVDEEGVFRVTQELIMRLGDGDGLNNHIQIEVTGDFQLRGLEDSPEKADFAESFKAIHAPAMLYGLTRGVIAMISGVSPPGKFILPSIQLQRGSTGKN